VLIRARMRVGEPSRLPWEGRALPCQKPNSGGPRQGGTGSDRRYSNGSHGTESVPWAGANPADLRFMNAQSVN
jgi:hypothetical protein